MLWRLYTRACVRARLVANIAGIEAICAEAAASDTREI
jgi:hypothetical protein